MANFRRNSPPQTILGAKQKEWFIQKLRASKATWKIWGNSIGTLEMRADLQNLPGNFTKPWPAWGYACTPNGDWACAYAERAEIYDAVQRAGITGFAIVAGDRHSFWAGLAAKALPPDRFEPVGIAFITGSISAPGLLEAMEHKINKDLATASAPSRGLCGREKTKALGQHVGTSWRSFLFGVCEKRRSAKST